MVRKFDNVRVPLNPTTKLAPAVTIESHGPNYFHSTTALSTPQKEMRGQDVRWVMTDMGIAEKEHGPSIAHLRNPKTRITSLDGVSPAPKVFDRAIIRIGEAICICVPDEMMMGTAISFAGNGIPLSHLRCDY